MNNDIQTNFDIPNNQIKEVTEEDLNKTQTEIQALKAQRENLIKMSNQEPSLQNQYPEPLEMNNYGGQGQVQANTLSKTSSPFSVNHTNNWNAGFANKLIMALIAGFGMGAFVTAAYIFLNIGKFTFTL
ncbi:MAG: hypothetical protein IJ093_02215 [Bacilli bacterium]|nr:hypothetical protein [Bacilli bacterium]